VTRLLRPWESSSHWLCLLFLVGSGCGRPEDRPNVLLITLDTTRYDAVGFAGAPQGITPFLDRLEAESVVYDWARTVCPLTLPAHASILTGLYPPRHGLRTNGLRTLPESADTLAERARESGYATAAFIAARVLADTTGLDQGFEIYDQPEPGAADLTVVQRPAAAVLAEARAWLAARDGSRPFFAWVHLYDPHEPYDAPSEYFEQVREVCSPPFDKYYAEVAEMDAALGALFDDLRERGQWADTFCAVTSDHGEALGQHGEGTHGPYVYDATMRVPLLLRFPDGHRAGERSSEVVSLVDLYPTLLSAMGLVARDSIDGESLYRRRVAPERGVYFESFDGYVTYGWSPLAGWADRELKYVHGPQPELYAAADDPHERRDLWSGSAPPAALAALRALGQASVLPQGEGRDASALAELASLGYAGTDDTRLVYPDPLEPTDRPDPRSRRDELRESTRAFALQNEGRFEQAVEVHRDVLERFPDSLATLQRLGYCLMRLGRDEEAAEAFRRYLALQPDNANVLQNLGAALYRLERFDEAIDAWERSLHLAPDHVPTLRFLGPALEARGDLEAARAVARHLQELLAARGVAR